MLRAWRAGQAVVSEHRLALFLLSAVVFFFGCIWRLGSLLPGASPAEAISIKSSASWGGVWNDPMNAPYHLVQFLTLKLPVATLTGGRIASSVLLVLFTTCLYFVVKRWFGTTASIFAVLLFLTTPYAMILGRTATPQILLFGISALALVFSWVLYSERNLYFAWIALCIACAMCLYVPGLIWLVIVGLAASYRELKRVLKELPPEILYGGLFAGIVAMVPLLWALLNGRSRLESVLWLPQQWASIIVIIKYLGWSLLSVSVKTPHHTSYILGQSPMLSASQTVLVIFGVYGVASRARRGINWLAALAVPAAVLFAINQSLAPIYLTLPLFITFAAVGMRFLYLEWRRVFPLNPIPRYLALGLISIILLLQIAYSFRYVLVAWPHNRAVKAAYMIK